MVRRTLICVALYVLFIKYLIVKVHNAKHLKHTNTARCSHFLFVYVCIQRLKSITNLLKILKNIPSYMHSLLLFSVLLLVKTQFVT